VVEQKPEPFEADELPDEPESEAISPEPAETRRAAKPRVVVAIVDTGIYPYHPVFRATRNVEPVPGAQPIQLTLGEGGSGLEHDGLVWRRLEYNQLYSFPGTIIAGAISFGQPRNFLSEGTNRSGPPILENVVDGYHGHGTAVASTLARFGPNVDLVLVQDDFRDSPQNAYEWILQQPWIDIVSISRGSYTEIDYRPEESKTVRMTKRLVEAGKVVFLSAGNNPVPSTVAVSGMPWVISIGGASSAHRSQAILASTFPDFVADYWAEAAQAGTNRTGVTMGTSLAAPAAAAVAAEILLKLREATGTTTGTRGLLIDASGPGMLEGGFTNHELRALLNTTAAYWYEPSAKAPNASLRCDVVFCEGVLAVPVGPAAWLQMGWGYLGPEIIDLAVNVALGLAEPPRKPAAAEDFMRQHYALRERLWTGG